MSNSNDLTKVIENKVEETEEVVAEEVDSKGKEEVAEVVTEVVSEEIEEIEVKHFANKDHVIKLAEKEDLEDDLKEIYDLVLKKVSLIVSTGKLTAEHLRPLILNIIEIVQDYTTNKYEHIDGSQKKAMAMNVLRHVIVDLHNNRQINQEQYEMILLSLEFFGGALIDLGKAAYKLLVTVVDDVSENGCKGCFGRNFRRKISNK